MSRDADEGRLQAIKGMNDVLPPESAKWNYIERRARSLFEGHGYREIRIPILEYTSLFVRTIGEATDVVEKEMYTFLDRDKRSITLRPEGTASAVRAYLEHSVHVKEPVTRWYYSGPMFRHERPQKGRYRQFYQMGVEAFGVAEPTIDAEQIALLQTFFADLGITGLDVLVNSVGGPEDRPLYRAALLSYLEPRRASLCEDCQRRLVTNPLRVLDCKVEGCARAIQGAPSVLDHLGQGAREHFEGVTEALKELEVPFRVEPRLVRGLDYYTGTIFEVRAIASDLGAQNTLGGGGRYDSLVREMGGPSTPAIGFAFGMERLALTLPGEPETFDVAPEVFFASHGEAARLRCLKLAQKLRARGFRIELWHRTTSMKAQMKRADKLLARTVVVVGDEELADQHLVLRDMKSGEQRRIAEDELVPELKKILRG
ncbi:MAG: histidine--tRNA ligase [Deltaproteobacteria bacterium]|nr:histidine--tRNA ligase [Deltaproteobacteria bacterium]